jgi:hypothetical protein
MAVLSHPQKPEAKINAEEIFAGMSASGNSRPSQPVSPVGALPLRPEGRPEAGPATVYWLCALESAWIRTLQADLVVSCSVTTGLRNGQTENLPAFARQLAPISGIRPIGENPKRKSRPYLGLFRPHRAEKPDRQLVAERLAEREGFEPPIRLPVCRISSAVHSTALPPLQVPVL